MADTPPQSSIQSPDYARGYRDGLTAGFDQGLLAQGGSTEPSNARKVAAAFVLFAGLVGAGGLLLTRGKKTDQELGMTVLVTSSVFASVITSIQILTSGGNKL